MKGLKKNLIYYVLFKNVFFHSFEYINPYNPKISYDVFLCQLIKLMIKAIGRKIKPGRFDHIALYFFLIFLCLF